MDPHTLFWRRLLELLFWLCLLALLTRMANAELGRNLEATCRITYQAGKQSQHVGTGVALARVGGELKVLTAAHVVDAQLGAEVSLVFWQAGAPRDPVTGRVEWCSYAPGTARDVAIVTVPVSAWEHSSPEPVGLAPPEMRLAMGDPVASAGCAHGAWPTAFVGHVVAQLGAAVEFEPAPAEGRSGSALFDLQSGRIVGLVDWQTADRRRGRAMSLAELYRAFEGLPPGPVTDEPPRRPQQTVRPNRFEALIPVVPRCSTCGQRHTSEYG